VDSTGRRSRPNQHGQALSEYAMLVAIVGMGLVVILGLFGRATKQAWQHSENTFAQEPVAYGGGGGGGGGGSSGRPYSGGVAGDVQHTPHAPPPNNSPDSNSTADSTGAQPDTTQIIQ
jgi:Flp pilus assembly pilin Flp